MSENRGAPQAPGPLPSRRDQLLQLKEKLGKATGPDRDLDARLHALAHFSDPKWTCVFPENNETGTYSTHNLDWCAGSPPTTIYHVGRFTQSLDAAVGLVPEGVQMDTISGGNDKPAYVAFSLDGSIYLNDADGATLPLAICSARIGYELAKEQS